MQEVNFLLLLIGSLFINRLAFSLEIKVHHPCKKHSFSKQVLLSQSQSVFEASKTLFEAQQIPFIFIKNPDPKKSMFASILDTPVSSEQTIFFPDPDSNETMYMFGWCFLKNNKITTDLLVENYDRIEWFYCYNINKNGTWNEHPQFASWLATKNNFAFNQWFNEQICSSITQNDLQYNLLFADAEEN